MKTSRSAEIEILRARPMDSKALALLFDQYRQFYKKPSDVDSAGNFLRERLEKEESVILFAKQNEVLVGFVQLYPSYSSVSLQKIWILNDLFIHPQNRRQSVGLQFLKKAEDFARETGAKGLSLKTAHDNLAARALYESHGWRQDKKFITYVWDVSPN